MTQPPMKGFDEEQVRVVLKIPAHVRVLFSAGDETSPWRGQQTSRSAIASSNGVCRNISKPYPMEKLDQGNAVSVSNGRATCRFLRLD